MDRPRLIQFPELVNERANLTIAEGMDLPFEVKRVFWLTEIEDPMVRGQHAHRSSKQLLLAIKGEIEVELESIHGDHFNFKLNTSRTALYIPPWFWGKIKFHPNSIGLAFADDIYNEEDYIRDYYEFKSLKHD